MSGNNDAASDSRFLSCISFRAVKSSFDMYSPLRGEELPSVVISCHPTVNPTWGPVGPWNIRGVAGGYHLVEPDVL